MSDQMLVSNVAPNAINTPDMWGAKTFWNETKQNWADFRGARYRNIAGKYNMLGTIMEDYTGSLEHKTALARTRMQYAGKGLNDHWNFTKAMGKSTFNFMNAGWDGGKGWYRPATKYGAVAAGVAGLFGAGYMLSRDSD